MFAGDVVRSSVVGGRELRGPELGVRKPEGEAQERQKPHLGVWTGSELSQEQISASLVHAPL